MVLYELVTELIHHTCKEGYIWCKDGSFIHPSKFRNSGKKAYGYALSDNKVASLKRSISAYEWSGSDSPFYQRITLAESSTDGVANSNALKNTEGYSLINCPAIYRCLDYTNAGINSYMPAIRELSDLHSSIMDGKMKDDLITAGIYEECNYRESISGPSLSEDDWCWIWSSSQYDSDTYTWSVYYNGYAYRDAKVNYSLYVIPFFKF